MNTKRIYFGAQQISIAPSKEFESFNQTHVIQAKAISMSIKIPIATCFCSCNPYANIHDEKCPNYKK